MLEASVYDAKTNLSRYLALLESGEEDSVIIKKYDEPVAVLRPYRDAGKPYKVGLARGEFAVGDAVGKER